MPSGDRARRGEEGYNLIILMVLVTVMNIMVAAALPSWSHFAKREKESELIFRGMQYAEAIRIFQQRHGRLPIRLEELIEVEPRSIRQLYSDPMSEVGRWGLLIQAAQPAGRGRNQGRPGAAAPADQGQNQNVQAGTGGPGPPPTTRDGSELPRGVGFPGDPRSGQRRGGNMVAVPPSAGEDRFGRPTEQTTGPIVGVYSAVDEQSLRTFAGKSSYSLWQFHLGLIPTPVMLGGDNPAPRVHSNWVGKPFRSDLDVQQAGATPNTGQEATGSGRPDPSLRPSSFRPNSRRPNAGRPNQRRP